MLASIYTGIMKHKLVILFALLFLMMLQYAYYLNAIKVIGGAIFSQASEERCNEFSRASLGNLTLSYNVDDIYKQSMQASSKNFVILRLEADEKSNDTNFVTVVTNYFRIPHSKHNHQLYMTWMRNLFSSIKHVPVVVITDVHSVNDIYNLTSDLKSSQNAQLKVTFYVVDSSWSSVKQLEMERNICYANNYIFYQPSVDVEFLRHNPNLYSIWNSKAYYLNLSATKNFYNSSFFVYTDIGAFRNYVYKDWPDRSFARHLKNYLNDRILFGQVTPMPGDFNSSKVNFIQAGFFAGSALAIRRFSDGYYRVQDELLTRRQFVGKEQKLLNLLSADSLFKRHAVALQAYSSYNDCTLPYDVWFFYQTYMADSKSIGCLNVNDKLSNKFLRIFE